MKSFKRELLSTINKNVSNNYGIENFDEHRFGTYHAEHVTPWSQFIKKVKISSKKSIGYSHLFISTSLLKKYTGGLKFLWKSLDENGKTLLIKLIAFRILGQKKIKLPTNTSFYWERLDALNKLKDPNDTYNPKFLHYTLNKMNLKQIGYDIEFYYTPKGVLTDFVLEQYAYKSSGEKIVYAEKGDTVLDCGGCWGDTALYFAHNVGKQGKVYTFEFIPNNIEILQTNIDLNNHLKDRIELIPNPVSNKSDIEIYFTDNGPSSSINFEPYEEQTGQTKTISIDDFVSQHDIKEVNYIKMDIEGAEPLALQGAEKTIRKFRPKLAIAIYHSMDDFVNIPKWILDLNLDYEIYLGHYTIHLEETVIFAKPK
ncbi:FkbM family methyltransferase [Tamlana sp. 2201CG12-4]|uniref:FkbM family methyltransferase n=1 Tax=Tamlana sp. 2201CG12-4 TaxID=3112582 RepID=UPI002DB7F674|nr:FkbM family methyltransferase [Tamlana sp. 2201CG12-4]MEC3907400.1 FkbM family methyltransferase [Tamlana sp. 2201CG12-4]